MAVDTEKVRKAIDSVKEMTSNQLAVTIYLVIAAVMGAFWIENRYAKIAETKAQIEKTEVYIKKAELDIKKHKAEILQMHIKTLELIKLQPKPVQDAIERNSRAFMENYSRLESLEPPK